MEVHCPKACGECCKVVLMTRNNREKLTSRWDRTKGDDRASNWYFEHLKQISKREAVKIRPILKDIYWPGITYFICDYYDNETNKCLGYGKSRTTMCTDFPFYNDVVLDASRFKSIPECYYIHQIMKVN
jgi:Fe-S-cluster containining protein